MNNFGDWKREIDLIASIRGVVDLYPEQNKLLEEYYKMRYELPNNTFLLSAPPASGKSYVISLVIDHAIKDKIALIVPFYELKEEYIKNIHRKDVDILTLNEYIRKRKQYDIIIIDEFHNISNFLEYDSKFVTSCRFTYDTDEYDVLYARFMKPNTDYYANKLQSSTTKWIIDNIDFSKKYGIKKIKNNLSEYMCFIYISETYVELKFIHGNISNEFKTGTKKTFLFSATPLNFQELEFYCNIKKENIGKISNIKRMREYKNKVVIYEDSIFDTEHLKIDYINKVINNINGKSLILFKNRYSLRKAYDLFIKNNKKSSFYIESGLSPSERTKIYREYSDSEDAVLLTSSSVFWEGVNIKSLKCVILYEVPYPKPNIIDLINNRIDFKTSMKRRVIQGVGRVGRKSGELGIAILLFNTSFIKNVQKIENADQNIEKIKKYFESS